MSLNIKNEHVHDLVREAARRTGKSQTSVVEEALRRSQAVLAERRRQGALQERLAELTDRERDVMRLVAKGLPNKLIADQLAISVRTVEVHRARVFDKMDVKSAVELANLLRDL